MHIKPEHSNASSFPVKMSFIRSGKESYKNEGKLELGELVCKIQGRIRG